jgi:putative hydrolase of the HAD superfamily
MIDTLILDLDGVVRHWDPDQFASTVRSLGLTPAQFSAVAFEDELLASAMTGAISAEQWDEEIGRRLGERHGCDPATAAAAFAGAGWSIDEDVVALVKRVRAAGRARVALFSNASTRLESDLASCGVDAAFDVIFNSARLGIAKPDPEAFRTVASALGTEPERCLFVDDTVPNVDGARAAGMQAEAFTGVTALRSLLERAGLL